MKNYQVIVVGGGFSGVMAAIAAARDGYCRAKQSLRTRRSFEGLTKKN